MTSPRIILKMRFAGRILQIRKGTTVLQAVDYRYATQTEVSANPDLGGVNDLIQVKVSLRASGDTGSPSMVRYTQYRYTSTATAGTLVKAIYEHDAIERAMATLISNPSERDPPNLLSKPDDDGSTDRELKDFASRSFTYYPDSNFNVAADQTTAFGTENLGSKYDGGDIDESDLVKSETIRGACGACGGSGVNAAIVKQYYHMDWTPTNDQNRVVRIVVEDTVVGGTGKYRTVYGLENSGRLLRKAFIENPMSSEPKCWCESWKLKATGMKYRVAEYRLPSAHAVATPSQVRKFLHPYDGSSWANDSDTLRDNDGLTYLYDYNDEGMRKDWLVRNGESDTSPAYVSAVDYATTGTGAGYLVTASYYYPNRTPTRSSGVPTSYSYEFYNSDYRQIKKRTATFPAIQTGANGSGTATSITQFSDTFGRLRWTRDGEGYVDYVTYNPVTGGVALVARDVDPDDPPEDVDGDDSDYWDDWTVGGANDGANKPDRGSGLPTALALVAKTYFDEQGRKVLDIDPGGRKHAVAYKNRQIIRFPYWNTSTTTTLLPVSVTVQGDGVHVTEEFDVRAGYDSFAVDTDLVADLTIPVGFSTAPDQDDYTSWTRNTLDEMTGRLVYVDRYHAIPAAPMTGFDYGALGTNFHRTVHKYDGLGRPEAEIEVVSGSSLSDSVEQVTQFAYDLRDRLIEEKKGVSAAGHSMQSTTPYDTNPSMTTLRQIEYDGGGVGDGYVTKTKAYFGTGTDFTAMEYHRDFRGRTRGTVSFNGSTLLKPFTIQDVDWAGHVVATADYDADTEPTWTGGSGVVADEDYAATTTADRRRLSKSYFDDLGRLYRSERYKVNASNGAAGDRFQTDRYYDRNNRVVASATKHGSASEVAYDGVGRQYQSRTVLELNSTLYSSGVFQYRAPAPKPSLAAMQTAGGGNGGVLTLSHSEFDNSGNPTGQHVLECNHDDNNGLAMETDGYVRRTAYSWYDGADRVTTTADFGSGDAASGAGVWKYTTLPPADSEPTASSDTKLVTKYAYKADTGRQEVMTDPAGTKTKVFFDDLGRQTFVARNWDDFSPTAMPTGAGDATDKSKDVVTGHVYNGLGQTTAMTVYTVSGENQTTKYLYESTVDAAWVTNEIYPDSADSDSTGSDQVKFEYNVDGSRKKKTDQRGTVLDYTYNNRRQLEFEKVTTLGGSTDGHVRSIKRMYETDLGRLEKVTSYSTTDDTGTVRNQVKLTYNELDQVTKSEQSHEGAVSTTPSVQYVYDASPDGGVFQFQHRLKQTIYPSGRTVFYDFDTANSGYAPNRLSRVRSIRSTDGSGTEWTKYSYAGTDRLVIADYPEIDVKLDYFQGTTAVYAGLDRFGRIKDQYWDGYGMTADVDRFKYGYDYASSRTYRDIDTTIYGTNNKDQAYTYDGLHRLKTFDQGTLASGTITMPTSEQDWGLDALGNWSSFITKAGGMTNLNQSRTVNKVNEITDISASVGSTWADPVYDAAGNATTVPNPNGLGTAITTTYDAWNRAIEVKWPVFGNITLEKYEYDGLGRRIVRTILPGSSNDIQHSYYNEDWQELEVRREVSGTESANPLEQFVWHPYYIDALGTRFYDSDVSNSTGVVQHYFTHDANFNVTAAVDTSPAVVERYEYTPYGKLTFLDPNFANDSDGVSDIENAYTYTGRRFDAATGLYHYRYRQYAPDLGNFVTRDPIGYDGGDENLYRYVMNNAITVMDPAGLTIYLKTGNNTSNPINNEIHQNVCVDIWTVDCTGHPVRKGELKCFSFGQIGFGFRWFKTTWLGWSSLTLAGFVGIGEIYEAEDTGVEVGIKVASVDEEKRWLAWMLSERVGTQDVYSVGRHNCRTYSQWEFKDAPGNH